MKSITQIMAEDHSKMGQLCAYIEKLLKEDLEKAKKVFNKFKWTLEKHFFVEEKVIFSIYSASRSEEENDHLLEILKEHKDILFLISQIEESFENNEIPRFAELSEDLIAHAKFEDEFLYPRLDEELSEEQKQIIYDRSDEVIRG